MIKQRQETRRLKLRIFDSRRLQKINETVAHAHTHELNTEIR